MFCLGRVLSSFVFVSFLGICHRHSFIYLIFCGDAPITYAYIFIYLFNLGIIKFVCLFVFRGAVTLVDWLVCLYLCVLSQVYYLIIIIICLFCHLFPVSGRYYHRFIHL